MDERSPLLSHAARAAAAAALLALSACQAPVATPVTATWVVGRDRPAFDPDGPPEPTRWAIERLLTRGLVGIGSDGRVEPDAADRVEVSADGLVYTFRLRADLRFTDGSRCGSGDFARALLGGLARTDHGTRAWLLAAVRGMDRVRAGRPLPALGIETPDDSTLVVRLAFPDSLLPMKLALPGVSAAWVSRDRGPWSGAVGIGRFRVVEDSGRNLELARAFPGDPGASVADPDTLVVRCRVGARGARSLMRTGTTDLVWPLPPGLLDEELPAGYRRAARAAAPERFLLLVARADTPPTTRLAARRALAHGINRGALLRELHPVGEDFAEWLPGAGRFDFPKLDGGEIRRWMERGKLGRSFHVVMAYDADGAAAEVARLVQGEWARHAIYVELEPLRGESLAREVLRGSAHLALVEAQALLPDPASALAALVMPLRGPAVGAFRTGWRTREFDAWIAARGAAPPLPAARAGRRLEEELVALPVARLPWTWVERAGAPATGFDPRFGPEWAAALRAAPPAGR